MVSELSTPRESVRAAFKTILDVVFVSGGTGASFGVAVYDRLPFEGADQRSVILTMVSGTSRSPGAGLRKSLTKRGLIDQYRLQVDCNYDDKTVCGQLADAVEQALMDAIDTLRTTYDIHNLRKMLDVDALPIGTSLRVPVLTREARIIQDYTFWTHRELAT